MTIGFLASYLIIKQLKYGRSDTEDEDDDDDDISERDHNSDMMIHHDGPKPFQFFLADGSIAPSGVGCDITTSNVTGGVEHHLANKEKSGGGVVAE